MNSKQILLIGGVFAMVGIGLSIGTIVHITLINDLEEHDCEIVSNDRGDYRCCSRRCNHGCSSCSTGFPSCEILLDSLMEGECCGGYHCCATSCSRCCSRRSCRSCNCYCSYSTFDRRCQVDCDTCYHPKINLKYFSNVMERDVKGEIDIECGRNTDCLQEFLGMGRVNSTVVCHASIDAPTDIFLEIPHNIALYVFTGIFDLLAIIIIGISCFSRY